MDEQTKQAIRQAIREAVREQQMPPQNPQQQQQQKPPQEEQKGGGSMKVGVQTPDGKQAQVESSQVTIQVGPDTWLITPGQQGAINMHSAGGGNLVIRPVAIDSVDILNPASRGNG